MDAMSRSSDAAHFPNFAVSLVSPQEPAVNFHGTPHRRGVICEIVPTQTRETLIDCEASKSWTCPQRVNSRWPCRSGWQLTLEIEAVIPFGFAGGA
jgi:hypothetical protein